MGLLRYRHLLPTLLSLAVVFVTLWAQVVDRGLVADLRDRLEYVAYDLRFNFTRPFHGQPEMADIAIVDVDEKSLEEQGQWPWPRYELARLVDRIFAAGAVVVGLDMTFPENERNLARRLEERLRGLEGVQLDPATQQLLDRAAPRLDGDRALARSLKDGEVVMGYMLDNESGRKGTLGPPLRARGLPEDLDRTPVRSLSDYVANLPELQNAARSGGFFSVFPDDDGIIRRYNLLLGHQGEVYPSLTLEMARQFMVARGVRVETAPLGDRLALESIAIPGLSQPIPTDGAGRVLVPYRGPRGSFPYISATDVLEGRLDEGELANTLVLVGSSAQGLYDLRATPVQNVYPGVEVHANVLAGLLQQDFPLRPNWAEGANFTFMALVGLLLALLLPRLSPLPLSVVTLAAFATVASVNLGLWIQYNWVLPLALPLVMVLALGLVNMAYGFLFEERNRRMIKSMFGQYVPPELVDEMVNDPDSAQSMEGERRDMTVLFADVRGFTTISESLTAAQLKDLLNRLFTPMTEVIFHNRGTIDKYEGDMIMAFWGAPLEDPEHHSHALEGAMQMLERNREVKEQLREAGLPEAEMGIGLNSGPMNVGNMGSEYRRAYTVLGDAVNLGARIEGLTKFYGARLLVGEQTAANQQGFLLRRVDRVRVKGKHEPVALYEPLARQSQASPALQAEVAEHERALEDYWALRWEEARRRFEALAADRPDDRVYQLYLERMDTMDPAELPADWDGVFEHTSK
jgi:adenylate cyclase